MVAPQSIYSPFDDLEQVDSSTDNLKPRSKSNMSQNMEQSSQVDYEMAGMDHTPASSMASQSQPNDIDTWDFQQSQRVYRPYFLIIMTVIQVIMLIISLAQNYTFTGSIIQTNPFNIMLGADPLILVRLGARFVPCMKSQSKLSNARIQCPDKLSPNNDGVCTLNDLCPLKSGETADQWWRFFVPIFLHAGFVHLAFNLSFQIQVGFSLERSYGWWRISIIYFAGGIFGFIFGGNFAAETARTSFHENLTYRIYHKRYIASVGCSGALFGLLGCLLLDIVFNWRFLTRPQSELVKLVLIVLVSFLVGLLPGVDNFSHIGGFIMGILTGLLLVPRRQFTKWDHGKKYLLYLIAIPLIILLFAGLLISFYDNTSSSICPWCKYLSCLPIAGLCDISATS